LIVIDFIDMHAAKNRAKVAQALAAGLKGDKARTTVGTISQFGLLEMSRQRIDMELSMGLRTTCGVCNGTGSIPTVPASANNLLRKIRTLAAAGRYGELHADLPMDLSNYMLNSKREALRDLELEFEIQIHLFGDPDLSPGHVVELSGKAPRLAEGAEPVGEFVEEPAAVSQTGKELGMRGGRKRRRRRGRGGLEREEAASVESHDFSHDDEDREMLEIPPDSLDEDEDKDEDKEEAGAPAQWEEERSDESAATTYEQYAAAPEESARDRDNGRPLDDGDTRILFSSAHVVTRPDAPPQPPRMVRSSPFKAIAKTAKPGLLFDSEQRGGIVVEHFAVVAAAEPEARLEIARAAPEPARRPSASAQPLPAPLDGEKPPRRRHRRGRGGHAQVPAAAGEPGADEEAAPEEEAEQPEPVAAKPRARRAASPRKPRARGPRRPVDADADPNGNVKPRVEDFELPEVNGNIVARER
jgi:ribonuclease E